MTRLRTSIPLKWGVSGAFLTVGLLFSILVYTPNPLAERLIETVGRTLATRIPRPTLSDDARLDGIIVLGGSPTRVRAALDLARQHQGVPVVLSGPGSNEIALGKKKAAPETPVVVDHRPKTTYENAFYSQSFAGLREGGCWVVVTSAVHMPRALGAFQALGVPVVPWPVDDTPRSMEHLSTWVWHEVLGLIGYRAFGRTSALFPKISAPCAITTGDGTNRPSPAVGTGRPISWGVSRYVRNFA